MSMAKLITAQYVKDDVLLCHVLEWQNGSTGKCDGICKALVVPMKALGLHESARLLKKKRRRKGLNMEIYQITAQSKSTLATDPSSTVTGLP